MKIVLCTGGFDPVHEGHIKYLKAARSLGDYLVVGLNSDNWLAAKKGTPFMTYNTRLAIVSSFSFVDAVIDFDDTDSTAIGAIAKLLECYPGSTIVFANGGDRTSSDIPEIRKFGRDPRVKFVFGVGGDEKLESSSNLLLKNRAPEISKEWGQFLVLDSNSKYKIKKLLLDPGASTSTQSHSMRSESFIVLSGTGTLTVAGVEHVLVPGETLTIPVGSVHSLRNDGNCVLELVEVQLGQCFETDIIRY